jgi:hypothetical protein
MERSVQPKNTFTKRGVVWVISQSTSKPRDGSTLSSSNRLSSPIARSASTLTLAQGRRQRTEPFFIYPCSVMSLSKGGSDTRSRSFGRARCSWRRATRPTPSRWGRRRARGGIRRATARSRGCGQSRFRSPRSARAHAHRLIAGRRRHGSASNSEPGLMAKIQSTSPNTNSNLRSA